MSDPLDSFKRHREKLHEEEVKLLAMAKEHLPELKTLLTEVSDHWGYEDPIYRFYHHSFKVYWLQNATDSMVQHLQALAPHLELNADFMAIIMAGTGKTWERSHNEDWRTHTRPIVEAFFHARHMLEMVCKYAETLKETPSILPSGYATVLYLYNLR